MAPDERLYVVWHRCVVDDYDHAVTDEEFISGCYPGEGRYVAACGHVVYPGSMLLAPGPPCARCNAYLRARATLRTAQERMTDGPSRPNLWRRLLRRIQSPAVPQPCPPQDTDSPARDGRTQAPAEAGRTPSAPVSVGRHRLRRCP